MNNFNEHVINFNLIAEEDLVDCGNSVYQERLNVLTNNLDDIAYENEYVDETSNLNRFLYRIEGEIRAMTSVFYRNDKEKIEYSDCCYDDEEKQLCKV